MPAFKDLTGQRFGRYVVQYKLQDRTPSGRIRYHCKCDCGNESDVSGGNLTTAHTQSCGCLSKEVTSKLMFKDITGKRFGKLLVISCVGVNDQQHYSWNCRCDCGNLIVADGVYLRFGDTKSCGCLSREVTSIRNKERRKKWEPINMGSYFLIPATKKNKTVYIKISPEDLDKVKKYTWHLNRGNYAKTDVTIGYKKRKPINLGAYLLDIQDNKTIFCDHKDGNVLDYRRSNIRKATRVQNARNRKVGKNSTTGYKGVSRSAKGYSAHITISIGKRISLGQFKTKKQAARAYDEAALKYFEGYHRLNIQENDPNNIANEPKTEQLDLFNNNLSVTSA